MTNDHVLLCRDAPVGRLLIGPTPCREVLLILNLSCLRRWAGGKIKDGFPIGNVGDDGDDGFSKIHEENDGEDRFLKIQAGNDGVHGIASSVFGRTRFVGRTM